jgi:hypothetical protein
VAEVKGPWLKAVELVLFGVIGIVVAVEVVLAARSCR